MSNRFAKSLAIASLVAASAAVATLAHAADPRGGINAADRYDYSFHTSSRDPYTDGARAGKRDPYTDGARVTDPRNPYTDGARTDSTDAYTKGANLSPAQMKPYGLQLAGMDRTGVSSTPGSGS